MKMIIRSFAVALALVSSAAFAQSGSGSSPLSVPKGGSGISTAAAYGILYGNGAAPLGIIAAGSNGQLLIGQSGAAAQFKTITGDVSFTNGGTAAIGPNKVTDAMLRQSAALSLVGRASNSVGNVADISAAAGSSCAFRESGNAVSCGALATAAYAANSVTNAKLAQMANNTVKCRVTAGTGDPEDCNAAQVRSVAGLNNVQNVDTTTQANVAFTGLSVAAAAADADTLPVNQGAGNLKQTFAAIKTWIKAWIVKGDVGLGSVANVDQTDASNISSGTLGSSRLPSPFTGGTASGNTSKFATVSGSSAAGNCAQWDSNGNIVDSGAACGGGGGGGGVNAPGGLGYAQAISAKYYSDVSGSSAGTTATTVASNTTVALASAIDFANGQGIRINRAGASFSASPPTSASATPQGVSGSTTYTYTISCLSGTGTVVDGGVGAAITPFSTTTGNATLSRANYNFISWTAGAGCVGYAIYRSIAGTQTLIGFAVGTGFNDYGATAIAAPDFVPTTASGSSLNKWLLTSIVSGAGTTSIVLAVAPSQSASGLVVNHSDSVALQAWATACQAFSCYLDFGTYKIETEISFTAGAKVVGAGRNLSQIYMVNPFQHGLVLNLPTTGNPMTLSDFSVYGQTNTNSGACFYYTAPSAETFAPINDRTTCYNSAYGAYYNAVSQFKLVNSDLKGQSVSGVYVANTANADAGDSVIANNFISTGFGAVANVQYVSSGGLKIANNKLLSQVTASYGILMIQTSSTSSADLLVANNSIEGQYLNCMLLQNGASAVWSNILLTGNQCAGQLDGITFNGGTGWLNNATISGNIVQQSPNSCISIAGVTNYTITGNVCTGTSVANKIGISGSATAVNGSVVGNSITGYPIYYSFVGPVALNLTNTKTSASSGSQSITMFKLGLPTSYTSGAKCDFSVSGNVTSVTGGSAFGSWTAAQSSTAGTSPTTVATTTAVQTPTNANNFVNSVTTAADLVNFVTTINPGGAGSLINGSIKCSGAAFTLTVGWLLGRDVGHSNNDNLPMWQVHAA